MHNANNNHFIEHILIYNGKMNLGFVHTKIFLKCQRHLCYNSTILFYTLCILRLLWIKFMHFMMMEKSALLKKWKITINTLIHNIIFALLYQKIKPEKECFMFNWSLSISSMTLYRQNIKQIYNDEYEHRVVNSGHWG